jgi:transcriptional regulator with XRE-family HTH domain
MARGMTPVGELIRAAREQAGISRSELNRRLNGPLAAGSHINRIERGEVSPTVDTLERVAAALGRDLVIEFRGETDAAASA